MMTTLVDCRISHCDLEVVDFIMQHISLVFVVDTLGVSPTHDASEMMICSFL